VIDFSYRDPWRMTCWSIVCVNELHTSNFHARFPLILLSRTDTRSYGRRLWKIAPTSHSAWSRAIEKEDRRCGSLTTHALALDVCLTPPASHSIYVIRLKRRRTIIATENRSAAKTKSANESAIQPDPIQSMSDIPVRCVIDNFEASYRGPTKHVKALINTSERDTQRRILIVN
jgi:hypothetical protein